MNHPLRYTFFVTLAFSFFMGAIQGCGGEPVTQSQCSDCNGGLTIPTFKLKTALEFVSTNNSSGSLVQRELLLKAIKFGGNNLGSLRAYNLDLTTGLVYSTSGQGQLYRLTSQQLLQLKNIFANSVFMYFPHLFSQPDKIACLMDYKYGYATLITESQNFEAGSGSTGCEFDLYNTQTRAPAGLREFLDVIVREVQTRS